MTTRNKPFEFSKLPDMDNRKKESHFDHITTILEENNLVKKQIPEGPGTLLKAISNSLYFTSHYNTEIQQFCIKHLRFLIANNKLPSRLNMFKGNSTLWKDFSAHPHLPGFEKVLLELVSLLFKVKVTLYHISDDHYLHATIVNHKFDKGVEIIRTHGNHIDSVRTKKFMEAAGFCQNIVLNLIEQAFNGGKSSSSSTVVPWKNINNDTYVNMEYDTWTIQNNELANKEGLKITKGRHKKSLSDNFNVNFNSLEEEKLKIYNMFMSSAPPDEFMKLLSKDRKETEDNLGLLHGDARFMEEPWFETPNNDMAIKNYPVSSSNLSSRVSSIHDLHGMEKDHTPSINNTTAASTTANPINQAMRPQARSVNDISGKIFFNDNLSNTEIQQMENKQQQNLTPRGADDRHGSPTHFARSPPPGLTPNRYPQKTYSSDNMVFTVHTPEKVKAQSQVFDYTPEALSMYNLLNTPPSTAFHNPAAPGGIGFMSRKAQTPNPKSLMLSGFGDPSNSDVDQKLQFAALSADKRKPIILDEGKSRHIGRLKFFDENKNYGFIIMDEDGSDIFVHYDDLQKAGINKEFLKAARMGQVIKLAFNCMKYIGKYDKSRKATDIQLMN
jgi:hypothetical protein